MPAEAPRTFALVGHPVERSLSPALFAAAFAELGMPHRYELRPAPTEAHALAAFSDLRDGRLDGLNVTMPHKRLALASAARASAEARACCAANVLARGPGGELVAHNTDALALARLLSRRTGRGGALVVGAGGAGLAAVWAARSVGLDPVVVATRSWRDPASIEADPRAVEVRRAGGRPHVLADVEGAYGRVFAVAVQATASGMVADDPAAEPFAAALPWGALREEALALDVVYRPRSTPFARAARAAHLEAEGGLEMLILQASRAFCLWFEGEPGCAPRELERVESAMRAAALGGAK